MLRKRREPKARKSFAEALLRDIQGTAAEKLALFEKLKARGGFAAVLCRVVPSSLVLLPIVNGSCRPLPSSQNLQDMVG